MYPHLYMYIYLLWHVLNWVFSCNISTTTLTPIDVSSLVQVHTTVLTYPELTSSACYLSCITSTQPKTPNYHPHWCFPTFTSTPICCDMYWVDFFNLKFSCFTSNPTPNTQCCNPPSSVQVHTSVVTCPGLTFLV